MRVPTDSVLKSMIGQYVARVRAVRFCHVAKILDHDAKRKMSAAVVYAALYDGKIEKIIICVQYRSDQHGNFYIASHAYQAQNS